MSEMGNPVDPRTCSNFAHDELQLVVELDQLVHMTAEDTSEFWIQLEHVHGSTGFTAHGNALAYENEGWPADGPVD